jgi:hypothetical protein
VNVGAGAAQQSLVVRPTDAKSPQPLRIRLASGVSGPTSIDTDAYRGAVQVMVRQYFATQAARKTAGSPAISVLRSPLLPEVSHTALAARAAQAFLQARLLVLHYGLVSDRIPQNVFYRQTHPRGRGITRTASFRYSICRMAIPPRHLLRVTFTPRSDLYFALTFYDRWATSVGGPCDTPSINSEELHRNGDGTITVLIGPGASGRSPNGLDTLGRRFGMILYRELTLEQETEAVPKPVRDEQIRAELIAEAYVQSTATLT